MSDYNLSVNISKLLKEEANGRLDLPDGSYISQAPSGGIRLVGVNGYKKDYNNGANYYRLPASEEIYLTDMQSDSPLDGTLSVFTYPVDCIWECRDGRRFRSLGEVGTPDYADWTLISNSSEANWIDIGNAQASANDAQTAADTAQVTAVTAQNTADGKAPLRRLLTGAGPHNAAIGDRLTLYNTGGVARINDPATTTAGHSYTLIVQAGTTNFNGTGTEFAASRFEIVRSFNGSVWSTLPPELATPLPVSSGGTGAITAPAAVTNLTTVRDVASTAYTLLTSDSGQILRFTAATDVTLTITGDLGSNFNCMIIQAGAGRVIRATGGGATVNAFGSATRTAGQHACATILRVAAFTYNFSGNLTA